MAVEFRVVDLADNIHPHCVEMSLTQFKVRSPFWYGLFSVGAVTNPRSSGAQLVP